MDITLVESPEPEEPDPVTAQFMSLVEAEFGTPEAQEEPPSDIYILETWLDLAEAFNRAADAAANVRRKVADAGFSPSACDVMGGHVWGTLVQVMAADLLKRKPSLF